MTTTMCDSKKILNCQSWLTIGDRTEWSLIRSVIILSNDKLDAHTVLLVLKSG